jgi:hypothetical protein
MHTERDNFYDFIITASLKDIQANGMVLSDVLKQSQKLNLLCDNEVVYFMENRFFEKPPSDFLTDIQERIIYHRDEEIAIKNAKVKKGGFIRLANGSRVQGTAHVGGLQPDYIIDSKSSEIKEFLKDVHSLENMSVAQKIDGIGQILRHKYIHRTEYDDPVYLELMNHYRNQSLEIPLSEYLKIQRGVCREISLLTVLAQNEIGIESYYYYAKVQTEFSGVQKTEDHAVVISNIDNDFYVIDNYFRMFNGFRLEDLNSGVTCHSGKMYDDIKHSTEGFSQITISRLYPESRHNSNYIR